MTSNTRKQKSGFTLIELMVVIFIVGILSAAAIPFMRGRIDSSKWSEGKTIAGTIRTAARAYIAEKGNDFTFQGTTLTQLGFAPGDLAGRYFKDGDYTIVFTDIGGGAEPQYLITVTSNPAVTPDAPGEPAAVTIDDAGTLTEIP